jgi:hypothetical protein
MAHEFAQMRDHGGRGRIEIPPFRLASRSVWILPSPLQGQNNSVITDSRRADSLVRHEPLLAVRSQIDNTGR